MFNPFNNGFKPFNDSTDFDSNDFDIKGANPPFLPNFSSANEMFIFETLQNNLQKDILIDDLVDADFEDDDEDKDDDLD